VCELQEDTGLKHNLLCHHLKGLGKLGLIKAVHKKQFTYYEINVKNFKRFIKGLNVMLGGK
jgi:DNA-binding transcriptional ArsR family regulator